MENMVGQPKFFFQNRHQRKQNPGTKLKMAAATFSEAISSRSEFKLTELLIFLENEITIDKMLHEKDVNIISRYTINFISADEFNHD